MTDIDLSRFELIEWAILVLFSLILPLSIFFGRGSIRKRRLAALRDLEEKAFKANKHGPSPILPSLELVRARYEQAAFGGANGKGNLSLYASELMAYLLPTAIFVLITLVGMYLVFSSIHSQWASPHLLLIGLSSNAADAKSYQSVTALVVSAGFLGAYIWSISYLVLRVANFDLTPLDFLRVSAHILLTALLTGVFRHFVGASTEAQLATATVLVASFVMGLVPSLGLDTLIDRLPASFRLKRVIAEASDISREFPLDLIDGIDSAIKFRLANYEINDVQNLATENPINLYVGTPYNLLQIIDWIAQAQLLIAVGPKNYLELRKVNIRDVFSLLDVGSSPEGAALLKRCLFDPAGSPEVMDVCLQTIQSSLHVKRLINLKQTIAGTLETASHAPLRLAAE
jgi:hypothetical protein